MKFRFLFFVLVLVVFVMVIFFCDVNDWGGEVSELVLSIIVLIVEDFDGIGYFYDDFLLGYEDEIVDYVEIYSL